MASYLLYVFTTKDLHVSCSLHVLASIKYHIEISQRVMVANPIAEYQPLVNAMMLKCS